MNEIKILHSESRAVIQSIITDILYWRKNGRARYDIGWHNPETTYLVWSCRENGLNATTKNYDSLKTWRKEKTRPSPENLERWNIHSHEWTRSKNGRIKQSNAMEYESRKASSDVLKLHYIYIYIYIYICAYRLLDTWDRNGSTSGPTPWQIYDDDDYDDNCAWIISWLCQCLTLYSISFRVFDEWWIGED